MDRILDESHSIDKDNGEVSWVTEEHERPLTDFCWSALSFLSFFLFFQKNPLDEKGISHFSEGFLE